MNFPLADFAFSAKIRSAEPQRCKDVHRQCPLWAGIFVYPLALTYLGGFSIEKVNVKKNGSKLIAASNIFEVQFQGFTLGFQKRCLAPYIRPVIFGFSNSVSGAGGSMFNA